MPSQPPAATILVVDDDAGIRDSVVVLLEEPGRRVLTAAGGAEGLAVLEREAVDLIVSDLEMPHMDGLAFLAAARSMRPGVPGLLMTARTSPRAEEAVERGEVLACVPKSGDPGALAAEVTRALGREEG